MSPRPRTQALAAADPSFPDLPPDGCPVEDALRLLTGKWRMMVLFRLRAGPVRFNALQRSLSPVTQKVLTATLRALEDDGLIWRKSEATVPPHVTYGLTPMAKGLDPVFDALAHWRLRGRADRPDPATPITTTRPDRAMP